MFQVVIAQLQNGCAQIEQQIRTFSYMTEELENVISIMSSLSGMGDIISQLRKQQRDMREEETILRQMLQVLNKVLMHYITCENRNINEFEQNNYSFVIRDVGVFELQRVSGLIR